MPPTETPPNPPTSAPEQPPASAPLKISTRRFGELDHSELVHLLDSLEGDQSKSRFRESIYISVIFYLLLAWLLVYGPKYIFHTGTLVPTAASIREKERMTEMALNRELQKAPPKPVKPPPKLDRKIIEQLQAMQRANQAAKPVEAPMPAPAPAPAPLPTQAPPVAQSPLPQAPMPQPQPRQQAAVPDSPMPQNPAPQSPGQSIAEAMRNAGKQQAGGGRQSSGTGTRVGQQSAGAGAEILSDTRGVDFTDYIKRLLRAIRAGWIPLIPEECSPPLNKEGTTLIRFTIEPNGVVSAMHLDDSTHDRAIDKAAWGAITGVGQFAPLPKEFKGPNLELRIQFIISHNAIDTN